MGSLASWSSVCNGWIERRVRRVCRYGRLNVVLNLRFMGTVVKECVVESGLYSHWGGLDRCSTSGRKLVVII